MNRETLKFANELTRSIDVLDDLHCIMCAPYPQFSGHDKNVNSVAFDKETLKRLKVVIAEFIEGRRKELQEEFKQL
ncbi:hypothetical protein [Romboutsia ilealis]|jgi:hypothetical protein|uniref:hypothetical protein n=1 Tax=Romboutsia ilealis TaxID=1115758 RepID=UPI0026F3AD14|nr:hypothetical protein [Romboutsia ilealis]